MPGGRAASSVSFPRRSEDRLAAAVTQARSPFRHRTPRESPAFAVKILFPISTETIEVHPARIG
eukprot:scaffold340_cov256-Pinguiococcus_pyrenoidosus.AAC.31